MEVVEQELTKVARSQFFATFDFSHGNWQQLLHHSSQVSRSFITPNGSFSPTHILHGTTNAVLCLQSTLAAHINDKLERFVLLWQHDIFVHATTATELLTAV